VVQKNSTINWLIQSYTRFSGSRGVMSTEKIFEVARDVLCISEYFEKAGYTSRSTSSVICWYMR